MWRALIGLTMLVSLIFVPMAPAVIVDGVAIAVGNKIITRSEIDLRIRLTAFQNNARPDLSPEQRREAAQRLIDQKLVEREMDLGRYPRRGMDAIPSLLDAYIKTNFHDSKAAFGASASTDGLTPAEIGADLAWQSDFLNFLNLRFRPAVEVTEADIRKYFNEKFAPRISPEEQEATFSELHPQIEEQLTVAGADRELDAWLKDQRQRTKIDYVEKDLMAAAANTEPTGQ